MYHCIIHENVYCQSLVWESIQAVFLNINNEKNSVRNHTNMEKKEGKILNFKKCCFALSIMAVNRLTKTSIRLKHCYILFDLNTF